MPKSKKKKGGKKAVSGASSESSNKEGLIQVDPCRVRFQHSRIRPFFSGCGRSVTGTLDEVRQGRLKPSQLPPIQVLVGPIDPIDKLPWYFSLNNRRLWVLKRCREEGLLGDDNINTVSVRVRKPKSDQERIRYTLENCALEATFVREKTPNVDSTTTKPVGSAEAPASLEKEKDLTSSLAETSLVDAAVTDNLSSDAEEMSSVESASGDQQHRREVLLTKNRFQLPSDSDSSDSED